MQLSRLINEKNGVSIITALGDDSLGKEAFSFSKKEGIDISLIESLKDYPTGKATVFLNEQKVPDYIIHESAAWDNIRYSDKIDKALENEYDIFYCNILSQRSSVSYDTFKKIIVKVKAKYIVFDVTVRKEYYTKEKIESSLNFINILKINEDELNVIKELFYPSIGIIDTSKLLHIIKKDFSISYIFLTLGKKGACLLSDNGFIEEFSRDIKVVDTLGAGDSFCAALSYAISKGFNDKKVLRFASAVSEEIIQLKGGTALYDTEALKKKNLV